MLYSLKFERFEIIMSLNERNVILNLKKKRV
jgi:hypothetical protein